MTHRSIMVEASARKHRGLILTGTALMALTSIAMSWLVLEGAPYLWVLMAICLLVQAVGLCVNACILYELGRWDG